jgi:predicted SnoaL-like aldol condensation-catalyzing enzyme
MYAAHAQWYPCCPLANAACPMPRREEPFEQQERLFRLTRSGYVLDDGDGFMLNKRSARFVVLVTIWTATVTYLGAYGETPIATDPQEEGKSLTSEGTMLRDLFDRWERVWHEGQYDLVAQCVQPNYIRHDEAGDRTVTREAYAAEIAKTRKERPEIRIVVYDHTFEGDRAWFRFEFRWTDPKTGEKRKRAGMQVYRIEDGKLAETWLNAPTTRLGMDRCRCAGALDECAANQVRLVAGWTLNRALLTSSGWSASSWCPTRDR